MLRGGIFEKLPTKSIPWQTERSAASAAELVRGALAASAPDVGFAREISELDSRTLPSSSPVGGQAWRHLSET